MFNRFLQLNFVSNYIKIRHNHGLADSFLVKITRNYSKKVLIQTKGIHYTKKETCFYAMNVCFIGLGVCYITNI